MDSFRFAGPTRTPKIVQFFQQHGGHGNRDIIWDHFIDRAFPSSIAPRTRRLYVVPMLIGC